MRCKVVYGCCATGWRDITAPLSYEDCLQYLRAHQDQIPTEGDPHYTNSLDIMSVDSGRLMSWVL